MYELRSSGGAVEDNPRKAVDSLRKSVKNARFQSVLHFWRPNWWISPGFQNHNREKQLICWAMHEDSWCFLALISALCGYATTSTILYCAQRFSHLLTPALMRIDSLACRLIVPRYSWQTYPDLAVSRFPSEVCENARFQSVLHIWRPNWWMSLGIENYNTMHEDNWYFSGFYISSLWLRNNIYHPVLSTNVQSFIDTTAHENWFVGMQTDGA